jgi:hypothetical protein
VLPVDSETFLMTDDFMNLKIKPAQFLEGALRGMVYMYVFIREVLIRV